MSLIKLQTFDDVKFMFDVLWKTLAFIMAVSEESDLLVALTPGVKRNIFPALMTKLGLYKFFKSLLSLHEYKETSFLVMARRMFCSAKRQSWRRYYLTFFFAIDIGSRCSLQASFSRLHSQHSKFLLTYEWAQ